MWFHTDYSYHSVWRAHDRFHVCNLNSQNRSSGVLLNLELLIDADGEIEEFMQKIQ